MILRKYIYIYVDARKTKIFIGQFLMFSDLDVDKTARQLSDMKQMLMKPTIPRDVY